MKAWMDSSPVKQLRDIRTWESLGTIGYYIMINHANELTTNHLRPTR